MKAIWRRRGRNLPLMAASLLLAALFWFLVTVRQKIEVSYLVPLVFEKIPANLVIDGTPLGSVYVRLQGSRQTVENILPQQLQARVDLAGAGPGSNFIQITSQMVDLPRGVTLLGISPSYLDLKFLSRASVPVRIRIVGEPAPGYEIKEVSSSPPEVAVVGPPERVETVRHVDTAAVHVNGRRTGIRERAEFLLPSNQIRILEPRATEIFIDIGPRPAGRDKERHGAPPR